MSILPPPPAAEKVLGLTPPTRRGRSTRLLGQVVLDLDLARPEQVEASLVRGRADRTPLGQVMLEEGILTEEALARVLAERFGLDHVDLSEFPVDMRAANLVSATAARRYGAVPIGWADRKTLWVAMRDPGNVVALDDIAMLTGLGVRPAIASAADIDLLLARLNRPEDAVDDGATAAGALAEAPAPGGREDDARVIKLVGSVLAQAVARGASDIHFSPHGRDMRVQYRIDGVLGDGVTVPQELRHGVVARVKLLAELDVAERRTPQEGRVALDVEGRPVDLRVVTLPLVDGESLVVRMLDRSGPRLGLDQLGLGGAECERLREALDRAYGAVLVTGPAGAGKTTTLYAALSELNTGARSVVTIEDPVEYRVDGVRQMPANARSGVDFPTGLGSLMRADPDMVMVGEIRDRETARIAVEAALTDHLVLSGLSTGDAPSALSRLIEMGVEPFLVASAVHCVVAQRLARRLCPDCKRPRDYDEATLQAAGFRGAETFAAYEPVGCRRCSHTGYKGRVGLFELLPVTEEVRARVLGRDTADRIAAAATEAGMRPLRDDGLEKARRGDTSLAEVARVAGAS